MKRIDFFLLILLATFFFTSYSQEKMEVEGAIIIKDSEDTSPTQGTIRFNPMNNDFEGWNGLQWVSLTGLQYEIGEMTDQEGTTYPTVIIGNQEWMAKNLRTSTYRNGNPITFLDSDAPGNADWEVANYGAYGIYDTVGSGYTSFVINEFGHLYNWYAVDDTRRLCPLGWSVPSGDDINSKWKTLIDFLGGLPEAGGKMKEAGLAHWTSPNAGATNESGFTGLPGGYRLFNGAFFNLGITGNWWSSSGFEANAWSRFLSFSNDMAGQLNDDKRIGISVRCIRD